MVILMRPDAVAEQWEVIKDAIVPILLNDKDVDRVKENRILENIIKGIMQCWLMVSNDAIIALATTMFVINPDTTRSLLITSLYGYRMVDSNEWTEGLLHLSKYAKSNGCESITGYTKSKSVISVVDAANARKEIFFTIKIGDGND